MSTRPDRKSRKLQRQASTTGKSIKPCDSFKSNVWRPEKCANCFFSRSEHSGSPDSPVPINVKELSRLQDLLAAGLIQTAEFERRKQELYVEAQTGVRSESPKRLPRSASKPIAPQPSSSAPYAGGQDASLSAQQKPSTPPTESIDIEAEEEADEILSSIIVVFFADGTERYNDMTAYALRTFIDATPRILVGLLTHDEQTATKVLDTLAPSQRHRVLTKLTSPQPHFDNWNPTQYKLDIAQYAEAFETVFWFDSDTITFGDMTEFLTTFAASDALFYMTPDHVNSDAEFTKNWTDRVGQLCVIPQACLMGFKDTVLTHFFTFWEAIWKHWITPKPFANFADPNPGFSGSEFCIEQYALGQALAYKEEWIRDVMWFRREPLAVPKSGAPPSGVFPSKKTSVQPNTLQKLIAQHPQNLVNVKELRSIKVPPKTMLKISNSIMVTEHFDYIDKFGNLYHCYNHSYERVKQWFQLYTAYGPSLIAQ